MKIICHNKGCYNFYCTISDGFEFVSSFTLDQLTQIIRDAYGQTGIDELPHRLERAHQRGHSSKSDETLRQFLCVNRAGQDEKCLPVDECIDRFLS